MNQFGRIAGCLLAAATVVSGPAAAQPSRGKVEIRVRVVHGWSGRPWKGVRLGIWGTKGRVWGGDMRDVVFETQEVKTGPDGVARFSLSSPLPQGLYLFSPAGPDFCTRQGTFSSDEVLHSGIVVKPDAVTCRVKERVLDKAKPTPGEILIFAEQNPWP